MDGSSLPGTLLPVLFVVGAAAVALALLRSRAGLWSGSATDFEIRCRRRGRVVVRGRIPSSKVGEIRSFFARDLDAPGGLVVRGSIGPNRSVRLRFSGPLSPAQQQRVRNFLIACLR